MLCSRIDEARQNGDDDPLLSGARIAFRPVLLTTALALFGLIPAATSHAMGSETQRPFAIAIVAGLLLATPIILLLLPVLYAGPAPGPRSIPPPPKPEEPAYDPIADLPAHEGPRQPGMESLPPRAQEKS